MSKKWLALFYPALVVYVALAGPATALAEGIPIQDLQQGGYSDFGGSTVIAPFASIGNAVIGILSGLLLIYAVFHLSLRVKDIISGKKTLQSAVGDFVGIGVGMIVLAISFAGGWYPLLNWFYTNVISKVLGNFH
ncbi:MAG: hypothetical protein A4E56_00429 [Pelotomaculum sp. PtaU1.Bin065]|nr:MAG: hypothetical protein A4E56_00429 [Pelotomaculum sp. PtaU1.Bin065]